MTAPYFHYGAEGVDDSGWGCVWRAAQNAALVALGGDAARVPTMAELRAELPREVHEVRPRGWAEPAHVAAALRARGLVVALYDTARSAAGGAIGTMLFLKSKPADYANKTPEEILELVESLRRIAPTLALVVDDGRSGTTWVPRPAADGGGFTEVDPHSTRGAVERAVPREEALRRLRRGLMLAVVWPAGTSPPLGPSEAPPPRWD